MDNLEHRLLFLITDPKMADKAVKMFREGAVPILYRINGTGTVSDEMLDMLGFGETDKNIIVSVLPKSFADIMLKKLNKELKLGSINSGIAYTIPLSGANSLLLRVLGEMNASEEEKAGKGVIVMDEFKHSLIVAVVNQGYSEEVMNAARDAGATGGTVIHSRRLGNEKSMGFWGMSIQAEKEMVFIVVRNDTKLNIMKEIGEKCGMRSEAKGVVVSLPIDSVIGLAEEN